MHYLFLIFRIDKPTPNQVSQMGDVIVHELAHKWFGDFVTMNWKNDLWFNEVSQILCVIYVKILLIRKL